MAKSMAMRDECMYGKKAAKKAPKVKKAAKKVAKKQK